jgi:hypothetical protein
VKTNKGAPERSHPGEMVAKCYTVLNDFSARADVRLTINDKTKNIASENTCRIQQRYMKQNECSVRTYPALHRTDVCACVAKKANTQPNTVSGVLDGCHQREMSFWVLTVSDLISRKTCTANNLPAANLSPARCNGLTDERLWQVEPKTWATLPWKLEKWKCFCT